MGNTMRITAMVIFILIGATVFSLVFQGVDGGIWIEHLLSYLPGGATGFLIFVNIFIFFLAFFLDFFEIAFIVIPLLAPVAKNLGIDLVWFGVLICINMQTAFMHPPFGFALFYLRGIAPKEVLTRDIYLGAIPWLGLQLLLVRHRDLLAGERDLLPRPRAEGGPGLRHHRPAAALHPRHAR
jgi:TRAP-type mannitol/chloroaromatic compound transport system permease large subunit